MSDSYGGEFGTRLFAQRAGRLGNVRFLRHDKRRLRTDYSIIASFPRSDRGSRTDVSAEQIQAWADSFEAACPPAGKYAKRTST